MVVVVVVVVVVQIGYEAILGRAPRASGSEGPHHQHRTSLDPDSQLLYFEQPKTKKKERAWDRAKKIVPSERIELSTFALQVQRNTTML